MHEGSRVQSKAAIQHLQCPVLSFSIYSLWWVPYNLDWAASGRIIWYIYQLCFSFFIFPRMSQKWKLWSCYYNVEPTVPSLVHCSLDIKRAVYHLLPDTFWVKSCFLAWLHMFLTTCVIIHTAESCKNCSRGPSHCSIHCVLDIANKVWNAGWFFHMLSSCSLFSAFTSHSDKGT